MISQQDVIDFLRAKKEGQLAETETLLLRLIEATEEDARVRDGVAPWYYEEMAILYRKQKRYDDEIAILQRFARAPKAPGAAPFRLAIRLEDALLVRDEGRNSARLKALRAKRVRDAHVTIETDLGVVTLKNPYQGTIAIIAAGQSEEYISWYYDIHRKAELVEAVDALKCFREGRKPRTSWNDGYFAFMQKAPGLLADLPNARDAALQNNRIKTDRKEVRVIWGPFKADQQRAEIAAKILRFGAAMRCAEIAQWFKSQPAEFDDDSMESFLIEPTLNAGWLDVRVIAVPKPGESEVEPAP